MATSDAGRHSMPKTVKRKSLRDAARPSRVSKRENSNITLACNQCRLKKVKCILQRDGCKQCIKLGIQCAGPSGDSRKCPSSKSHIQELYQRIAQLEAALEVATANQTAVIYQEPPKQSLIPQTPSSTSTSSSSIPSGDGDNIISRLCGRQWKLNTDEDGQYKFFGPTSSLHLTESVSSSLLGPGPRRSIAEDGSLNGLIDPDSQTHLLDIYWKYQHTVLQVFDREEFLEGMQTGQSQYFSKALLCAVYACAARISDRPTIRAMVVSSQDDLDDEQPLLVATAIKLVDQEIKRPQITTIQALLLLSVIHCGSSRDTKGWLLTGNACRLAIDFGLHSSGEQLATAKLTPRDVKVRRITYLGCLVFDRLWALYLGRPFCLQQSEDPDFEAHFTTNQDDPWEMRIAFAWAQLLLLIGRICEALNGERCTTDELYALDMQLLDWYQKLDLDIQYHQRASASVLVLHMQYYSTKIILHRPTAGFGSGESEESAMSSVAQRTCIDNAKNIANALRDYRHLYGDATTLSGVGLHVIATASTILIADISEKRSLDVAEQVSALATCVQSLSEMEKTYIVARRVRRIVRLVMSLCHLDIENTEMPQGSITTTKQSLTKQSLDMIRTGSDIPVGMSTPDFANMGGDVSVMSWNNALYANDLLLGSSQFDIMYSLDC